MRIEVKELGFVYSPKSPFEKVALDDITFTVNEGDTLGIVGSTGSGKSTLCRHFNALIRVQRGEITVGEIRLHAKKVDLKTLRKNVGMLFQFPEYQLFADTVKKDVEFGPLNFGFSAEEADATAREALELVGLDFDEVASKSPFELSGGQMRRAAIAGVLASRPSVLVLDEPTAGLDPRGKREILELVTALKAGVTGTVIIISHNMDEIAEFCNRVVVLENGKLLADTTPDELFNRSDIVERTELDYPHTVKIKRLLAEKGVFIDSSALNADELSAAIAGRFKA